MKTGSPAVQGFGRGVIKSIDSLIRRVSRVEPFNDHPECILRLALARSDRDIILSDGEAVHKGDPVVAFHLWNERLVTYTTDRGSLAWGRLLYQRLKTSFQLAVPAIEQDARYQACVALMGEMGFVTDFSVADTFFTRLGFEVHLVDRPGYRMWRKAFWDNLYTYLLMWTFNPRSQAGKRLGDLQRVQAWMSRARLLSRYSGEFVDDGAARP